MGECRESSFRSRLVAQTGVERTATVRHMSLDYLSLEPITNCELVREGALQRLPYRSFTDSVAMPREIVQQKGGKKGRNMKALICLMPRVTWSRHLKNAKAAGKGFLGF